MNEQFDFGRIGQVLHSAPPIELQIEPMTAYFLTALLQMAMRHPALKAQTNHAYENGLQITRQLQQRLGEIDPMIAQTIEAGFDESMDMSVQDFQQFSKSDDLPQRNYSQLRQDIKEEVLLNTFALGFACQMLAQHLGGNPEQWTQQLAAWAGEAVDLLTPDEVNQQIAKIDFQRDFVQ